MENNDARNRVAGEATSLRDDRTLASQGPGGLAERAPGRIDDEPARAVIDRPGAQINPFLDETLASRPERPSLGNPADLDETRGPGQRAHDQDAAAGRVELDETLLGRDPPVGERPSIPASSLRIGRYAVLSKLGEGGMGAVYSAFDEELDRRLAIKLVREHLLGETMGDARTQREAQALARLSHPNVVQVYDVGVHAGQVFIAMEFVRGSTLSEWRETVDPSRAADRRRIVDMYIQAGRGLAAAHERDLVHRDFKPDNVLVGEDGRARVLDFGLAASARPHVGEDHSNGDRDGSDLLRSTPDELLTSDLTRTGSVMGTPAYMAPEQFLARPSDARTDQFSFCVALYGALYDELPFAGETFAERKASVCDGDVQPAPKGSTVPDWLRSLLLTGLQARPEDRHPTMHALLQALADDPAIARARRLRLLSFVAGALALSVLVVAVALSGWDAWEQRRVEAKAHEDLVGMESRVAELNAAGDEVEAQRTFTSFVRNPAYRGTRALALAWLDHAEREAAASHHRRAIDAYAASYAIATSREHQVAALVALIRFSHERERWDGYVEAVATLEERAPEAFAEPRLAAARFSSAVVRRDLDGALALLDGGSPREQHLRRLVKALAPAHKTSVRGIFVDRYNPAGQGEYAFPAPGERIVRVAADLDLTPIATHRTTLRQLHGLAIDGGPYYVAHEQASQENVILRADGEQLTELARWSDAAVASSLVHDLNGDGHAGVYVGTGAYTRHMRELVEGPEGGWSTRPISAMVDNRRSDINSIVAADLDGDGVTEVVVAIGPWRAYELQVLRWDPATEELALVTREKLGNLDAALVRRGPGPPEIAVWKNDVYTTPMVFPKDQPRGAASGLHLFRLVDDRLVETASYPAPSDVSLAHARMMVGDLDGDGRDEMIVHDAREDSPGELASTTLIFTDDPEDPLGGLLRLPLAHTWPVDVRDLDGDGDAELLVRLDDEQLWVVGAGAQRLPIHGSGSGSDSGSDSGSGSGNGSGSRPPEVDTPDAPEVFSEVWRRSADLAQMGLEVQAAEAYGDLASATLDPELAAQALLRAAEIFEELGRDRLAAEHYVRAAETATVSAQAGVAAVRAYRRRGDIDGGYALLDHLLGDVPGLSTESASVLTSTRASLGQLGRGLALDFSAPIDRRWRIHRPHALHRDAASSTLRVDIVGAGLVAALPVTVADGLLSLEVDLDLLRVEWGESLEIGLADPEAAEVLRLGVIISGDGGQGDEWTTVTCDALGTSTTFNVKADPDQQGPGRHRVRVVLDRELGETSCAVTGADGEELLYRRVPIVGGVSIATQTELRIGGSGSNPTAWIAADVHGLSSIGIRVRDGEPLALATTRHALVEGDLGQALAQLDREPQAQLDRAPAGVATWRLLALARLGRWGEAEEVLRPLLVGTQGAELPTEPFVVLLRTMPEAANGLFYAVGAKELYQRWLIDTWGVVMNLRAKDPDAARVIRHALDELDPEDPRDPHILGRLFSLRATMFRQLGMYSRARSDYRTALAILGDSEPPADPEARAELRLRQVSWTLREASSAILAGDEEGGRALIAPLLEGPLDAAFVADMLRAWPEFTTLAEELDGL